MSQLVGDVAHWVTEEVYFFNYPGVFVLMALSNVYLPIPSQLVLPLWLPGRSGALLVPPGNLSLDGRIRGRNAGAVRPRALDRREASAAVL